MSNLTEYKKFPTIEEAVELQNLLKENGILADVQDVSPPVDITFSSNHMHDEYLVKIKSDDFDKANAILHENAKNLINTIERDYYLFDFSEEELKEILAKPDEWSELDYVLAQQILQERGLTIEESMLEFQKERRNSELARPEKRQKVMVAVGYFLSVFAALLGIIIGYTLMASKRKLPNGEKVYTYTEEDRKHGKNMIRIAVSLILLGLLLRLLMWR
jgi:hypothetical protein